MTKPDSLEDLLARCAAGDRTAFESLYRAASPKLYACTLALLKHKDAAEDVLQEGFVKIWTRANSYDPAKGSAMTWMTSIVRNRALDLLRAAGQAVEAVQTAEAEVHFAVETGPDAVTEMNASTAAVLNCLDQLKDEQKRCIMMAYVYGYSHQELARVLNSPLGTIKAWIRRGLERLRECLG